MAGIPEDTTGILSPRVAALCSSPQHHRSSPPPPNLSRITEDAMEHTPTNVPHNRHPHMLCNPQISITDELGEVTIPESETSTPEATGFSDFPTIFPTLSSCDPLRPSITRGIGKITPLQLQQSVVISNSDCSNNNDSNTPNDSNFGRNSRHEAYVKNETLRHSFPPNTTSHLFHTDSTDLTYFDESPNDLPMVELQKTSSGSFEVALSEVCSTLCVNDILDYIREQLVAKGSIVGETPDRSGLALQGPGGVQIELRVSGEADSRGLRMRRISGDQLQYSQLCHELLQCIRV